ncbi:apolipoprotein D [Parasteatoda tepidariorum]|uniref:apolipoprotein D n=1 Tax=Parasteatoda tepidariorum TaxID=114398 RepID=UPI00077FBBCE|nr:apolipoprotein D [Parasteatoda tepidariorum]
MKYLSIVLLVLAKLVSSLRPLKVDMCEHPPLMKDFDYRKMGGRWYEFARLPNPFQYLMPQRCNTQYMTVTDGGLNFNTSMIEESTGFEINFNGGLFPYPEAPYHMKFTIEMVGLEDWVDIVDAKYDEYVILYHCKPIGAFRFAFGWILTREKELSEEKKERLLKKVKSYNLGPRLEYESQKKCYD